MHEISAQAHLSIIEFSHKGINTINDQLPDIRKRAMAWVISSAFGVQMATLSIMQKITMGNYKIHPIK
jgi:hypothetical protein